MCSRGVNKKHYSARFVFICDTQRYYVYIFIYFFHPILVGQLSSWILNYGPTAVLLRLYRSTVCTRSLEYLCAPRGAYMTLWYRYRAVIIIITRPRVQTPEIRDIFLSVQRRRDIQILRIVMSTRAENVLLLSCEFFRFRVKRATYWWFYRYVYELHLCLCAHDF